MSKPGLLACLSSPSGGGKTTIAKMLVENGDDYDFSVSCTTRAPRNHEKHGVDYYFFSLDEFDEKIKSAALAEYEKVHGHYYGTLKAPIESAIQNGNVLIVDIDVKGAFTLKEKYGDQCITIFIQPPSIEKLKKRLMDRGTESEESINKRLQRIEMEIEEGKQFDKQFVNNKLEDAVKKAKTIIEDKRSELEEN